MEISQYNGSEEKVTLEEEQERLRKERLAHQIQGATNHAKKASKKKHDFPRISWDTIYAEAHKRYSKFGYNGYLGHLKAVQQWVEEQ